MLTKDDDVHSSGEESFHSAPEFPPFLCPCGKCSLEQFFSDNGCPKKKSSSDSKLLFPSLNLSNLDEDSRIDLEERLIDDTKEIMKQFTNFSSKICKSLRCLQVPLEEIKYSVLSLEAFIEEIGVKMLDEVDAEKIENAKSIGDLFIILRKYSSFFNYQIFEPRSISYVCLTLST